MAASLSLSLLVNPKNAEHSLAPSAPSNSSVEYEVVHSMVFIGFMVIAGLAVVAIAIYVGYLVVQRIKIAQLTRVPVPAHLRGTNPTSTRALCRDEFSHSHIEQPSFLPI